MAKEELINKLKDTILHDFICDRRLDRQKAKEIVVSILKAIEPDDREAIIKNIRALMKVGEKPITEEQYIELHRNDLIETPEKGKICLICLKGKVRLRSLGKGSYELYCNNTDCSFLYGED